MSTLPKGMVESALGFPVRESVARAIDAALKEQPAEVRTAFKAVVGESSVDGYCRVPVAAKSVKPDGGQTEISYVTTDAIDRDGEVVLPRGLNWDQWKQAGSPVVWNHDYKGMTLGRGLWVKLAAQDGSEGWLAKTEYAPRPPEHPAGAEWFPSTVWWMATNGYCPGKSIGFLPLSVRGPTSMELERKPTWKNAKAVIERAMCIEYSCAAIPCNPLSIVQGAQKAQAAGYVIGKSFQDAMGLVLADDVTAPAKEPPIVIDTKTAPEAVANTGTAADGGAAVKPDYAKCCPHCKGSAVTAEKAVPVVYSCDACKKCWTMNDQGETFDYQKKTVELPAPDPAELARKALEAARAVPPRYEPAAVKRYFGRLNAQRTLARQDVIREVVEDELARLLGKP